MDRTGWDLDIPMVSGQQFATKFALRPSSVAVRVAPGDVAHLQARLRCLHIPGKGYIGSLSRLIERGLLNQSAS